MEVSIANGELFGPASRASFGVCVEVHNAPAPPFMTDAMPMGALAAERSTLPRATIIDFVGPTPAPVRLRVINDSQGGAHHARLRIVVQAGVKAVLLESHEGRGGDYLANTFLEVTLYEGASLERIVIAEEVADAIAVTTADVCLMANSTFSQTMLTSGAKRQRIETRVEHYRSGAQLRMDGAYLLANQRHADITTVATHSVTDGTTSQLTKGVVRDQARGVFQGRIVVEKGADGTEARMGHHALILSDKAEVDARPELLIFADDVQCAHGNTIGALDEAAIFYARQRGMPEAVARAMLTEAFVGEVVDRIEHEGARDVARAWVSAQLGGAE